MSTLTLKLTGPAARGVRVSAALLRDVVSTVVDAVQQSVRLRADGRSRVAGAAPGWLERVSAFDVEIRAGSTELVMESRSLSELAPERFAQQDLFGPVDTRESCLDLFSEAIDDALGGSRGFELHLDSGETVRGVVGDRTDFQTLGPMIGTHVLATGRATFRPSGQVLRLETEAVGPAGPNASIWSAVPRPLGAALDARELHRHQGPRSGIAAILGQWPGDETDEEFDAAVNALS